MAIILAIAASMVVGNIKDVVITEANKEALGIAATAARLIEENAYDYNKLSKTSDYSKENFDREYYERMNRVLRMIKQDTNADFIFTEKRISDTEIEYIFDGEDPSSENFSPLGSKDSMSEQELKAFNEGIITLTGLIRDPVWGDYLTAFAPIRYTGEVVGLVGVDFSADHINAIVSNVSVITYLIFMLITILLYPIIYTLFKMHYSSLNNDFMTGLMNKRGFTLALNNAMSDAKITGKKFTLMFFDIDDFKAINDRCGHLRGDEIIKNIANKIKENTRHSDLSFRYGGDEFAVILPRTGKEEAFLVCRNIQDRISEDMLCSDNECCPTLSIGICESADEMTAEEMIKLADGAMYLSKQKGKNKITLQ